MNYSFKHSFHYPFTPLPPTSALPLASASAAEAAAAAIHAPHPPHMYPHQYRHPYHFRRFGFFRRFFWFGAGAVAATWWINHKQRQQRIAEGNGNGNSNEQTGSGSDRFDRFGAWRREWNDHRYPHSANHTAGGPPNGGSAQLEPSLAAHQAAQAAQTALDASTAPTVAATINPPSQVQAQSTQDTPRWGWKARRESREALKAQREADVQSPALAQTPAVLPNAQVNDSDDMTKIRAAVEALYAEKMHNVKEVQERANEKAKEYAREKLDQLSVALETLRQSLKQQDTPQIQTESKKLV